MCGSNLVKQNPEAHFVSILIFLTRMLPGSSTHQGFLGDVQFVNFHPGVYHSRFSALCKIHGKFQQSLLWLKKESAVMKPCFTLTKASNLEVIIASVEKTTHQGSWDKIISTSTGSTICPSSRQHISRFGVFDEFHKSSCGFYSLSLQDIGPLVAGDICVGMHILGIKLPIKPKCLWPCSKRKPHKQNAPNTFRIKNSHQNSSISNWNSCINSSEKCL